jgi:tetratricopeptide (TPR) repeat protein
MNVHRWRFVLIAGAAAVMIGGCGSSQTTVPPQGGAAAPLSARQQEMNANALRHLIDGSVYELQGDCARAVLEYQDALRYEPDPAIHFALAKCYTALGKHALAIEAGREAVRGAPDRLEYRRVLAQAQMAAFDIDGAIAQYHEIVARDSGAADAWFALARLYQSRKPLQSLDIYEEILRRFGPEWEVLLQIAELRSRMGQHGQAADALLELSSLDPSNQSLRKSLAQAYVRAGQLDSAYALYTELLERDPGNLEYTTERAGVLLMKQDYAGAARAFDDVLSRDTVTVDLKVHIGELYFAQVDEDSTLLPVTRGLFERIREKHPDDWRPYFYLGALGSMAGDDSSAVANFGRVTELAAWNADAWVYLSSAYLGKNRYEEAVQVLEPAVKAVPGDFRVNFFLGIAYNRLGRQADAVRVLERARQIDPASVDAAAQLAMVYDNLKMYAESDSLYETALRLKDDNPLVLNNYAYSLAVRNVRLDRALEMARGAVGMEPENASYLDTIGWIHFRLGRYPEAEEFIGRALSKGEENAEVLEHMGDVQFKLERPDLAVEYWRRALELAPDNEALRGKVSRGAL